MKVHILNEDATTYPGDLTKADLQFYLHFILAEVKKIDKRIIPEFTVIFVTKKAIHKLNLRYRNISKPTDVLSFSSDENGYLGDIILSKEVIQNYSKVFDCSFQCELQRDILHGILHLLGFDHTNNLQESPNEKMFQIQEKILAKYNTKA